MTEIDERIRHLEAEIKRLNSKPKLYKPAEMNVLSRPGTIYTPADGWIPVSSTWTYASATTITVPSGAASIYKVGQGIKLNNTDTKYFYIVGVADTVLTITGGSDYTLDSDAISAISYTNTPGTAIGFPVWFNWSPTVTFNGTAPTTLTSASSFRYFIVGKSCYLSIYAYYTNAGANNTTITVNSLPVAPVSSAVTENQYVATSVTNGVTPNLTAGFVRATGDIYIVCTSVSTNRLKVSGAYEI